MIQFITPIKKFEEQGEKTGWTYIEISAELTGKIKPNQRKSFRVKGKLDQTEFSGIAILPMGDGGFIMALNAAIRKKLGRRQGENVAVQMEADDTPIIFDADFMECLADEKRAYDFFNSLPKSHQHYFSKWIASAKTDDTKAKRISRSLKALNRHMGYGEMLREKE